MTSPRILVVDDESHLRELLEIALVKMGLDVDSADSLAAARQLLSQRDYALVLTDMRLLDGLGIELVHEVVASGKTMPIAVITAFGSADNAVMALKAGAFDYLSKPVALDQLRLMVRSALRVHASERNLSPSIGALPRSGVSNNKSAPPTLRLVGRSAAMQDLRSQIARLARSMAPIAISGESGSGKELAARDLHALSPRAEKPFVAVNCGAIPENLMEAEFFGYRKGAFTGAVEDRDGFFQAANGGTLLLDEVADLPLAMQVKLLRAIQERRVRKVGATTEEVVDVRLVSATHQNLAECVEKGRFRQDLYYRLNVIELHLPPLRERKDDIGLLAEVILMRLAILDLHQTTMTLSPAALQALQSYTFPGNVRELENILERALAFANDGIIEVCDLALKLSGVRHAEAFTAELRDPIGAEESAAAVASIMAMGEKLLEPAVAGVRTGANAGPGADILPPSLPTHLDDVERNIIRQALGRTQFNRTKAAELLGISFRQLRYRMQRLSIHEQD
ncbi:sigma-54-dependent transcriptional regulator [Glaciimonas immobilis]|uniref:Two-component system response regulator PilR (NtrC family) n=1 Tax=Glaciimonas immobilis TaxID=728004 RepID=A0A840RWM3_9BURK|nr:sigma-54 dependent transcriptional regulator [Glaciimonas immobilis]KAF3998636.1 sigma-54-dependent Fis family transcriptional regulator [Glaciimonas immobilis]MBB5201498.1 two-component system response regulator PilR (NtrC family) [Glaciimonas immobilis]